MQCLCKTYFSVSVLCEKEARLPLSLEEKKVGLAYEVMVTGQKWVYFILTWYQVPSGEVDCAEITALVDWA